MTYQEKMDWLKIHLYNCLGEELPNIQGQYTFGYHKLADNEMLAIEPQIILHGRTISTIKIESILEHCQNIPVLTKESFAIMCTNDPILRGWYLWNIERGFIPI